MILKQIQQSLKKILKIFKIILNIYEIFFTPILAKLAEIFVGLKPPSDLKILFDALCLLAAVCLGQRANGKKVWLGEG